jgi:hypothetical protein
MLSFCRFGLNYWSFGQILLVKTGFGVSRRQPERWFFRPKWRGEAKIALFLLFFAFWCRRDTVQSLVSCYDVGVREEEETADTGKRGFLSAVRGAPVSLCAHGVWSIGPIKTSEEGGRIVVRENVVVEFMGCMRKALSGEALLASRGERTASYEFD